jgi:peptidoglycan/xylan/chitin deacetylase (PgdA/CDA1 family)
MPKLRIDRFATLSLFQPLRRRVPRGTGGIPILMYHSISEMQSAGVHPYYQTATAPEVFAEHMKFLRENNYRVVALGDAVKEIEGPAGGSTKCVVITFDDGFRDFYTQAFPVLNYYGFSAIVFLPTAFIHESASRFKGSECLTWNQVRELRSAGIAFGSHTVSHPQLTTVKPHELEMEVRESKRVIEDKLGCPVGSFAYPYAFPETDRTFKQRLRAILTEAGYANGVSTIIGTADRTGDRFFMKRLPANSRDDLRLFQAKLEGAYDWLHALQYASKLITM